MERTKEKAAPGGLSGAASRAKASAHSADPQERYFEAFSRGVVLDGVVAQGPTIQANYSSDAWTNTDHWYSNHNNAYNQAPAVYDAYAKFFHTGTVAGVSIFGMNSGGKFAMAYGFSLDENPNVGSTSQSIPPSSWPNSLNVPAKTNYNVDRQTVTLTIGPWK